MRPIATDTKDYSDGLYTLGVPDEEVRRDLAKLTIGAMAAEPFTS